MDGWADEWKNGNCWGWNRWVGMVGCVLQLLRRENKDVMTGLTVGWLGRLVGRTMDTDLFFSSPLFSYTYLSSHIHTYSLVETF